MITSQGGYIQTKTIEVDKICEQAEIQNILKMNIILNKVVYSAAKTMCQKLGGKMPLPTAQKDFNATIGNHVYASKSLSAACKELWLPIIQV